MKKFVKIKNLINDLVYVVSSPIWKWPLCFKTIKNLYAIDKKILKGCDDVSSGCLMFPGLITPEYCWVKSWYKKEKINGAS